MTLLNIYESEVSTEFKNFLDQIKTNIEAYSEAKLKAQKERMIIIGKIAEYKQSFPQRSTDHRLLVKAMKEEGWSDDVISNNLIAFRRYQKLMNSHSDWHPLAQAASVSHLLLMARANDGLMETNALKYLKRHKKLPSLSAMRGYLAGWFDEKFRQRRRASGGGTSSEFNSESFDRSSNLEFEIVEDNQLVSGEKLVLILNEIDMDKAFINDAFKEKLEPHNHQLEVLADWSKPEKVKPKYL